jgi:hypothetical protein
MEEIKKVVQVLLNNFIVEEKGNTVTTNNMTGLAIKIDQALDGLITLNAPKEEEAPVKE